MRDRISNREVWEAMGLDADACIAGLRSLAARASSSATGSSRRSCPNVKSLGLLSDRQRERFEQLGILEYEHNSTSDVDHDVEIERRVRAGEIPAPA